MTKQLTKTFDYLEFPVRIFCIHDEPWWALVDICRILEIANPSDMSKRLDEDEKMTLDLSEGHSGQRGGAQSMILVNEPGLYEVILRSDKPEAKAFRRWLTHEVLPSIRKKGFYGSLTREDLMGQMRRMKISAEEYEEFLTGIPAYKKPMPVKMYNRTIKEWEENGERIYTVDDLPAAMRENMDLLESYIYKINRKSKNYHMIAYRPGAIKFSFGGLEKILDYGIRNKIIKRKDYMEALGIPTGIK